MRTQDLRQLSGAENAVTELEALQNFGINSKEGIEEKYLEYAYFEHKNVALNGRSGSMVLLHNICKYFQPKNVLETEYMVGLLCQF